MWPGSYRKSILSFFRCISVSSKVLRHFGNVSISGHQLLLPCDSLNKGRRNCTGNQNVPGQHNQCPQRYKTQYHPVRTYIMHPRRSQDGNTTRSKSSARKLLRNSRGLENNSPSLCSSSIRNVHLISMRAEPGKVISDIVCDVVSHSVFSGYAALCECSSSQRLNKG